mmetsp:Transcript_2702/g.7349  ORF Transcript_2702/g.7349 Transcript_2702/m.7349 type:complete len:331 (-) Transcript_2702:390-1382(-)
MCDGVGKTKISFSFVNRVVSHHFHAIQVRHETVRVERRVRALVSHQDVNQGNLHDVETRRYYAQARAASLAGARPLQAEGVGRRVLFVECPNHTGILRVQRRYLVHAGKHNYGNAVLVSRHRNRAPTRARQHRSVCQDSIRDENYFVDATGKREGCRIRRKRRGHVSVSQHARHRVTTAFRRALEHSHVEAVASPLGSLVEERCRGCELATSGYRENALVVADKLGRRFGNLHFALVEVIKEESNVVRHVLLPLVRVSARNASLPLSPTPGKRRREVEQMCVSRRTSPGAAPVVVVVTVVLVVVVTEAGADACALVAYALHDAPHDVVNR